ncbi:unnamed protein product [Owenia fusiformis]|uniref:Uncharacterized protein n=1 Tax=Owenia fusiformis TaxID=6347 RepID=A0A8S4N110_OWEFU|nr:unnamed protein product [Owenia fusiformis]
MANSMDENYANADLKKKETHQIDTSKNTITIKAENVYISGNKHNISSSSCISIHCGDSESNSEFVLESSDISDDKNDDTINFCQPQFKEPLSRSTFYVPTPNEDIVQLRLDGIPKTKRTDIAKSDPLPKKSACEHVPSARPASSPSGLITKVKSVVHGKSGYKQMDK